MSRFVRRRGSSGREDSRYYRALSVVAAVVALAAAFSLAAFALSPVKTTLFHVDPELQEELLAGRPAHAYVAAKAGARLAVPVEKLWVFGDLVIVKTRLASLQQLYDVSGRPGVISVYGAKRFRHAPLYYLDPDQFPFREYDADNRLHEATGAWTGRNVTVAVVDTGIDYTHPDFYDRENRTIIKALASMLYVSQSGQHLFWEPGVNGTMEDLLSLDLDLWRRYGEPAFLDINGHGTHVAGIIAGRGWASGGRYKGIAPGASLVVVKAFDRNGAASMDVALDALEWVYENVGRYGIDVLNLSWGAAFASDGRDPISLAASKIAEEGVLVFAAAGNEGNLPTTIVVPAVADKVFAVGAWDAYHDKVAPFSSLGPTLDLRMKPDLVAAGVFSVSCRSRYVRFPEEYMVGEYYVALSGTSMATPAAAGVAADFVEYYRYWHGAKPGYEDFVRWVEENSRRIGFVKDFLTGWGIPVAPH